MNTARPSLGLGVNDRFHRWSAPAVERTIVDDHESLADVPADHTDGIIHRDLDTDRERLAAEIAEIIAELTAKGVNELPTTWDCIDDDLENVFANPPSPEAKVEITFSYAGYQITVEQNGTARFVGIR